MEANDSKKMDNSFQELSSEELGKPTQGRIILQWVVGIALTVTTIGAMSLLYKVPDEFQIKENPIRRDTIFIVDKPINNFYYLIDTGTRVINKTSPPPSHPLQHGADLSSLDYSLTVTKTFNEPENEKPKVKYNLTGEYLNEYSNKVRWKISQTGNYISAEVFKKNGDKKGDAKGIISGDTLLLTSYVTWNGDNLGFFIIFDDGKILDGKIKDGLFGTLMNAKLIRQ